MFQKGMKKYNREHCYVYNLLEARHVAWIGNNCMGNSLESILLKNWNLILITWGNTVRM
jgi:hypothetical protein